jgi:alkanesulfonate monooxygenase
MSAVGRSPATARDPPMVEFIGMIFIQNQFEAKAAEGPLIDPEFTARCARAHEAAGFDRVLVGYFSFFPDGFQVAAYALHETRTLGILLAHRPGFVAPTVAARQRLRRNDAVKWYSSSVRVVGAGRGEERGVEHPLWAPHKPPGSRIWGGAQEK